MNAEVKTKELRPNARMFKATRAETHYVDHFFVLDEGKDKSILGSGDTVDAAWKEAALRAVIEQNRDLERQVANLEAQL